MKDNILIALILFLVFTVVSCGQKEIAKNEIKTDSGKLKKITGEEYETIRKQAQSETDKKVRRVVTNEIRNRIGLSSVLVKITQDFLPPDKSRWIVEEKSENEIKTTEIIYIGDTEYRKENGKSWVTNSFKSNSSGEETGFTGKSEENSKDFTSGEIEIDGETYRVLTSKSVSSQSKIISINKIWINKNNLIYKEESKSGLGNLDNVLSFSTTDYDYEVNDVKIEAPIK